MTTIYTIIAVIVLIAIANIKIVPQAHAYIIERFGGNTQFKKLF